MSIIRPGVHTTTSAPRFSCAICSFTPAPPYTAATLKLKDLANLRASLAIWTASSRAGAMMRPMGPSPSSSGYVATWSRMCRNMGRRKARVFPEPVLATPMTSRPLMMAGTACFWMLKGSFQLCLRRRLSSLSLRPHWDHLSTGGGHARPRTLMPILSRFPCTSFCVNRARARGTMYRFFRKGM
eukprot:scaffold927_cov230-Pinguiococcus_pyrenoidosus.AAC.13